MDLNTILIILGVIALIALVLHGLWSNRRERSQYFENANAFSADSRQSPQDRSAAQQDAAIVNPPPSFVEQPVVQPAMQQPAPAQHVPDFEPSQTQQTQTPQVEAPSSAEQIKIILPDSQLAYQMREEQAVMQPTVPQQEADGFRVTRAQNQSVSEEDIHPSSPQLQVHLQESVSTPAYPQSPISPAPLQQPLETHYEKQAEIEFDASSDDQDATDFLILYVVAAENRVFPGSRLTQALEELGFYLGKGSIYHRHLDLSAVSPVLFSAANITEPGTFDLYHLNDFSTVGITLFMQLPSEGNDRANLKMMIRAAKTLAEQLGGFVLNDQQEIFDDQSEQEYLARVN